MFNNSDAQLLQDGSGKDAPLAHELTKAAYKQFQIINHLAIVNKLPKDIIHLIGRYTEGLTPAEIFLELKMLFEERNLGSNLIIFNGFYSVQKGPFQPSENFNSPEATKAWKYLLKSLVARPSQKNPEEFNKNINRVLDYLLIVHAEYGKHILHLAMQKNNLGLINALLKRRKELISPSAFEPYKSLLDARNGKALNSGNALSPVQYAASIGNIKAYDLFIRAGAVIDQDLYHIHPLLFAVYHNQFDFVKNILERKKSSYFQADYVLTEIRIGGGEYCFYYSSKDGLLATACKSPTKNGEMIAFLIKQSLQSRVSSENEIVSIILGSHKEAAQIFVTVIGIDKVLTLDNVYSLINLAGGYETIASLTNTKVTDPKMLTLIVLGIFSQMLASSLTTPYSLEIFKRLLNQMSPIDHQACETNKTLIVRELKEWVANKPSLSALDPDPIAKMTEPQKSAWGFI
jgi:ankyrin repeat protein